MGRLLALPETKARVGILCLVIAVLCVAISWIEPDGRTFLVAPIVWAFFLLYEALRESRPREERISSGTYVPPRSLAIVSAGKPDSNDSPDLVVWMPAFRKCGSKVILREHVIGFLIRSLKEGGTLVPDNFLPHEAFAQLLHEFLARELPRRRGLQAAAKQQKNGWVSCVDARVLDAPGRGANAEPSPDDVFGTFKVYEGIIVRGSYRRNPAHKLFSEKGLFQLEYALCERLKEEIAARHTFRQPNQAVAEWVM
ncbi:MAG TPA: hypothetical protein VH583_02530 [Vicinamibacterales bacterium]|jgi:hypothetical protein